MSNEKAHRQDIKGLLMPSDWTPAALFIKTTSAKIRPLSFPGQVYTCGE